MTPADINKGALFTFQGAPFEPEATLAPLEEWLSQPGAPAMCDLVVICILTLDHVSAAVHKRTYLEDHHRRIAFKIDEERGRHPGGCPLFFHCPNSGREVINWIGPYVNSWGGGSA